MIDNERYTESLSFKCFIIILCPCSLQTLWWSSWYSAPLLHKLILTLKHYTQLQTNNHIQQEAVWYQSVPNCQRICLSFGQTGWLILSVRKIFLSDRKVSTIIVKVGVVLTFTFIMFSLYFVINGIQFHLLFKLLYCLSLNHVTLLNCSCENVEKDWIK